MCYRTRKEPLIYSEKFRDIVLRAYPDNESANEEMLRSLAYKMWDKEVFLD